MSRLERIDPVRDRASLADAVADAGASPRWACGVSRACPSMPRRTSPTSRCRSTPRRPAIRRSKPSSASRFRSRPRWPGLPRLDYTRSLSRYGLSQVTVVFEDGTDIYFARQQVAERIAQVKSQLPPGLEPELGPDRDRPGRDLPVHGHGGSGGATRPTAQPWTATDLRSLHDWVVRPQLRNTPGVTEVNTIGGYVRQIHVTPDPARLLAYGFTLDDVVDALSREQPERRRRLHRAQRPAAAGARSEPGAGPRRRSRTSCSTGATACRSASATSPAVGEGTELRTGAATQNGQEVVLGTVFMLIGENSRAVARAAAARVAEIQKSLPSGRVDPGGLRPHQPGRPHHRHRAHQPGRRRAAGDRRAVPAARQSARRADHRRGHSAGDADDGHRHGARRRVRKSHEPRRARLRPDRRRRRDHRRERAAPLRRGAGAARPRSCTARSASSSPRAPPPKSSGRACSASASSPRCTCRSSRSPASKERCSIPWRSPWCWR